MKAWLVVLFVAVFLGCTSTGLVGLCFLWFFIQELPKAQPAVALVLKRLRRRGNGLKSHPTDWEKPGIEPATPGLQDIGLSPTPFCGFPGYKPVPPGWFKIVCWFYAGNTQRLTESGFMEKPGIEPATPGLQGIALIPYTTAASQHVVHSSMGKQTYSGQLLQGYLWKYY